MINDGTLAKNKNKTAMQRCTRIQVAKRTNRNIQWLLRFTSYATVRFFFLLLQFCFYDSSTQTSSPTETLPA